MTNEMLLIEDSQGGLHMKRILAVLLCTFALVASACGAAGDSTAESEEENNGTEASSDETSGEEEGEMWGDLASPCGTGEATIAEGQGPATDVLHVGVANDRTSQVRNGLNKELWDAAVAFTEWCNEQGGIEGLQIELMDLDGELLSVENAMAQACDGVFAMVGGGYAMDQMQFSGKPESDFHLCELIDIPAMTVSVEKSMSNGQVQPLPNPANRKGTQWVQDLIRLYPEEMSQVVVVYGEALPSLLAIKAHWDAVAAEFPDDIETLTPIGYPTIGADWNVYTQRIISSGATAVFWIGEPDNAGTVKRHLSEQGWDGIFFSEANVYDQKFVDAAGAAADDRAVIRIAMHMFEEADQFPTIQFYLDNIREHVEDPKDDALLGLQGTSAWLLFATAAKTCAEKNDNVIDRTCVLQEANAIDNWTAGGLHAPTNPGREDPAECGMLITLNEGKWVRLYPEIGGEHDDVNGFHCPEDSVVEFEPPAGIGEPKIDPNREI